MERIACSAASCDSGDRAEPSRSCVASATPWRLITSSRVDSAGEERGETTVLVQREDDGGRVAAERRVVAVEREQRKQQREDVDRCEEAAARGCGEGAETTLRVLERLCETATMPKTTLWWSLKSERSCLKEAITVEVSRRGCRESGVRRNRWQYCSPRGSCTRRESA